MNIDKHSVKTMAWFRMYHEFATDPKVQMLSEADQRRFVMVLCLRCCNGDVTLHDDAVAFQLRVTVEDWQATKARLVARNLIDEDNRPVAWERRQYVSDRSNERVSRHRAAKKAACNVTVTPPESETETETDKVGHLEVAREARQADPNYEKVKAAFNGSTDRMLTDIRNFESPYGTRERAIQWLAVALDDFGLDATLAGYRMLTDDMAQGKKIRAPLALWAKSAQTMASNARQAATRDAGLTAAQRLAKLNRRF